MKAENKTQDEYHGTIRPRFLIERVGNDWNGMCIKISEMRSYKLLMWQLETISASFSFFVCRSLHLPRNFYFFSS